MFGESKKDREDVVGAFGEPKKDREDVVGAFGEPKKGCGVVVGALDESKMGYGDGVGVFAVSFWHKTRRGNAFLAPPLRDFRAVGGGHST